MPLCFWQALCDPIQFITATLLEFADQNRTKEVSIYYTSKVPRHGRSSGLVWNPRLSDPRAVAPAAE